MSTIQACDEHIEWDAWVNNERLHDFLQLILSMDVKIQDIDRIAGDNNGDRYSIIFQTFDTCYKNVEWLGDYYQIKNEWIL